MKIASILSLLYLVLMVEKGAALSLDFLPQDLRTLSSVKFISSSPCLDLNSETKTGKILIPQTLRLELDKTESTTTFDCKIKNGLTLAQSHIVYQQAFYYFHRQVTDKQTHQQIATALGWNVEPDLSQNRDPLLPVSNNFKSLAHMYAYLTASLVTDPSFQCAYPAKANFLKKHLRFEPPKADCKSSYNIKVVDLASGKSMSGKLLPERIIEIHFVFAAPGGDIFGSFGHSGFRVVTCRESLRDCPADKREDLFFGYAAEVKDGLLSLFKTLKGGYTVKPFFTYFRNTVTDYTHREERDLFSLPMNLTTDEKSALADRMVEDYWTNNGSYALLSRNCTTELLRLLRAATQRKEFYSKNTILPQSLYDFLKDLKVIDTDLLLNAKQAEAKGYFYPSNLRTLEKHFTNIQRLAERSYIENSETGLLPDELQSLNNYLLQTTPLQRQKYFERIQYYVAKEGFSAKGVAESFYRLEDRIYSVVDSYQDAKRSEVIRNELNKPQNKRFQDMMAVGMSLLATPVLGQGSGIPQETTAKRLNEAIPDLRSLVQFIDDLDKENSEIFETNDELKRRYNILDNIKFFEDEMLKQPTLQK